MKCLPLLLLAALLLPLSLPLSAKEPKKPAKGTPDIEEEPGLDRPYDLWGGKWDDGLLVFLRIFGPDEDWSKGFTEVRFVTQYKPEGTLYYSRKGGKAMPAGYTRADFVFFRLGLGDDPNVGLIYNERTRRMANLVKVQEFIADTDTYDIADAGWVSRHMPAEDALRIIQGTDYDLLGGYTSVTPPIRSAADEVLVDAMLLQTAKERWVEQGNHPANVTWEALKPFIFAENRVAMREGADLYGRPFSLGSATEGVKVHPATYALLYEAYPDVWGHFAPSPEAKDPQGE